LKLFPAKAPLEYVAVDILGPLPRSTSGQRFILVMTDRFSKFTRAIPMRTITAINVAKEFLHHWIFAYGAPTHVITDNGSQFTAQVFEFMCSHLGVNHALTTTYHPQTNGQAERFNRTLLSSLRAFAAEHPRTWSEFVGAVTYAYNTQVHSATKVPPFDLVITAPPPPMILQRTERLNASGDHRTERMRFRRYIRSLVADAKEALAESQAAYKKAFDNRLKPLKPTTAGDWVFIENAGPAEDATTGERRRHKLQWKAVGPYKVIRSTGNTVTVDRDGIIEVINRDRTSRAYRPAGIETEGEDEQDAEDNIGSTPSPPNPTTPIDAPVDIGIPPNKQPESSEYISSSSDDEGEHVLQNVVDYDFDSQLVRCRWYGYTSSEDTWQYLEDVPYSKITAYFRKNRIKIPKDLKNRCRPC